MDIIQSVVIVKGIESLPLKRPEDDLPPVGEVGESHPVVHPFPLLQQTVKRHGEFSQCQCAGDLHRQQCSVEHHLRFAPLNFVPVLRYGGG